jgi:DNA protecting protein DprA
LQSERTQLAWFFQLHLNAKEKRMVAKYITDLSVCLPLAFEELPIGSLDRKRELESLWKTFVTPKYPVLGPWDLPDFFQLSLSQNGPMAIQVSPHLDLVKLTQMRVGVIGSRHPTLWARQMAYQLGLSLAQSPKTVVSGGAIGIDSIVLNASLTAQNAGIAVLGSGMSELAPKSNNELFRQLDLMGGGSLSQFKESQRAQKWSFPARNVTIAALSQALIVVEAKATSGSLITANCALKLGVPLGVLLVSEKTDQNSGNFCLVDQGAEPLGSVSDVLNWLDQINEKKERSNLHWD